ncbi:DUF4124 domain-containing protein [Facilibium subflavum]|uniref:DUF4124 domain-containing protein n=1 Tax=Facilibium subflavum TaxID=2219058 RepID=UPI0013C2C20E|nr:DUF4124 domain-containing protein [Facilibium subflavum]
MSVYTKLNGLCQCFLLLFLFCHSQGGFAQIYQWQDKQGNVVISNTPPEENDESVREINIEEANIIPTDKDKQPAVRKTNTPSIKKTTSKTPPLSLNIMITNPKNPTYIHNFSPLIPLTTTPPPLSKDADVFLSINTKTQKAVYQNNTWNIPRPNPGENHIYIYGKTAENEPFRSNQITIYVYNTHVNKKLLN